MPDKDLQQLRQVLREAVRASRMPIRKMEESIGIGHGNLQRLLNGQVALHVRHLLALAKVLGVPPTDFFEAGCPDAMGRAKRRLSDWIGQPADKTAEPTAASLTLDQLKELIQSSVREAMESKEDEPEHSRRSRR